MWSLEFVEVADDELITKKSSDRSDDTSSRDTADVVEKSPSQPLDIPSSSVSSRHTNLGAAEYSSSLDSDTGHMQCAVENWLSAEKLSCDDATPTCHAVDSDRHQQSIDDSAPAAASAGEMFVMDDEDESQTNSIPAAAARVSPASRTDMLSSIPTVSIDTPESGEFCFITKQDVSDSISTGVQHRKLRDGFHWQKQLVFRSKLTMHTAFERKDNKDPAAVTALAVSRYSSRTAFTDLRYFLLSYGRNGSSLLSHVSCHTCKPVFRTQLACWLWTYASAFTTS